VHPGKEESHRRLDARHDLIREIYGRVWLAAARDADGRSCYAEWPDKETWQKRSTGRWFYDDHEIRSAFVERSQRSARRRSESSPWSGQTIG